MSCGDWRGVRKREADLPPRFSWIMDKRPEDETEESLKLDALWNLRRRGSVAVIEDDDWSVRRQGLKYDCRMRKSEEGAGRGFLERLRIEPLLPGALESPVTISTLWERLCLWKLGVLCIAGEVQ